MKSAAGAGRQSMTVLDSGLRIHMSAGLRALFAAARTMASVERRATSKVVARHRDVQQRKRARMAKQGRTYQELWLSNVV